MRGAYFLSLRSLVGGFPRENFRILEVHQCDFNALFGHLVLQSQGMMLITFHRLENLQITDHKDLNFSFKYHREYLCYISQS